MNTTLLLAEPRHTIHFVARDRAPTDRVLHNLKEAGFERTDISVLFVVRREGRRIRFATAQDDPSPPSSSEVRGVVAWLDGVQAVAIPGAAPLIVAGPLSRDFRPVDLNGIAAALVAIGLPDEEARSCVYQVLDGGYLIAVQSAQADGIRRARLVFDTEAAWAESRLVRRRS